MYLMTLTGAGICATMRNSARLRHDDNSRVFRQLDARIERMNQTVFHDARNRHWLPAKAR